MNATTNFAKVIVIIIKGLKRLGKVHDLERKIFTSSKVGTPKANQVGFA